MSSNPSIHSIVVQAIGGLPVEAKGYADVMWLDRPDLESKHFALIVQSTVWDRFLVSQKYSGGCDDTIERLSRSMIVLSVPLTIEFDAIPQSISLKTAHILTSRRRYWNASTFYYFILSHHEARIHPLVWMRIVAMLHEGGVFASVHQSNDGYLLSLRALILHILLPPSEALSPSCAAAGRRWAGPLELMSLQDTVKVYLQDTAHHYLLTMLSSYDIPSVPFPSASAKESSLHRISLAAGHFAVHTLASLSDKSFRQNDVIEESFGYLGGTIFRLHTSIYRYSHNREHLTNWLLKLSPFLERMTPSQLSNPGREEFLTAVLEVYHYYKMVNAITPDPSPDVLSRALPSLRAIFHICDLLILNHKVKWDMSRFYACTIMSRALTLGLEIVFHCFIQDEWISWMSGASAVCLKNDHVRGILNELLNNYVVGLSTISASVSDSTWHEFLEHLYEPRNLIFIVLFEIQASLQDTSPPIDYPNSLHEVVRLQPQHRSWAVCQEALNALVIWAKSPDRRIIPFPLQDIFDSPGYSDFRDVFRRIYEEDNKEASFGTVPLPRKQSLNDYRSELIQALESGLDIITTSIEERSDDTYGEGATDGIEQVLHAEDLDIPEIDSEQQMPGPSVQAS
ncbi:hypothetical protein BDZ89DRAFT_271835 [Hymenopellis radicata]|nr:hypothetical protein BDZ89DRAFT_271835 [Hymenopellis radicata]